jgi:hypothetical protein
MLTFTTAVQHAERGALQVGDRLRCVLALDAYQYEGVARVLTGQGEGACYAVRFSRYQIHTLEAGSRALVVLWHQPSQPKPAFVGVVEGYEVAVTA